MRTLLRTPLRTPLRHAAGAAAALALALLPAALAAQREYEADFPQARAQFLAQQPRQAAYTVAMASAFVRQEAGRSQDAETGMRLLAAESRLDRLVARLRDGAVSGVASLDSAFAGTDRLLAEHFWRMAAYDLATPRSVSRAVLARDLGQSARSFERALRWEGRAVPPAARPVLADAVRVADAIAANPTGALPDETKRTIDALGRVVVVPTAVIAAQQ